MTSKGKPVRLESIARLVDDGSIHNYSALSPSLKEREDLLCAVLRDRICKNDPRSILRVYSFYPDWSHHLLIERHNATAYIVPLPRDWYTSIPATIVYVVNRLFAHRLRTPKNKDD